MSEPEEMSETLQEFSLVCEPDFIFCDPGDDVVLSCHIQPAISAASMEIKWQYRADVICHYKDGQVTVSGGYENRVSLSLQDLHNGNVSLTLRNVRAPQRGVYICEVINKWQAKKEYIFLYVISENFRLVVPSHTISANPGDDIILPVHLTPETNAVFMKIKWLKGRECVYDCKYGQGTANSAFGNRVDFSTQNLERGDLSLTLRNVQQSDSGEYTCMVFHDRNVTTAVVHLQVRDIKYDLTENISRNLEDVLRLLENDLLQKTLEETLTLVRVLADSKDKDKKKKTIDLKDESPLERECNEVERENRHTSLHARRTRSAEEIPQMRDESTLERNRMEEERHFTSSYGLTLRLRRSTEVLRPLMGDESTVEQDRMEEERHFTSSYGLTSRLRRSTEVLRPLMRDESPLEGDADRPENMQSRLYTLEYMERERQSMSTIHTRAVSLTMGQEMLPPAISSEALPGQRPSESVISPAVATQPQENPETQPQERAGARAQSTQRQEHKERKCQLM